MMIWNSLFYCTLIFVLGDMIVFVLGDMFVVGNIVVGIVVASNDLGD